MIPQAHRSKSRSKLRQKIDGVNCLHGTIVEQVRRMHAFPRITAGLSAARAAMQRAVKERAATGSAADSLHRPEIFSVSVSPGVTAGFRQQPEMERGRLSRGKLARADRKRASRNGESVPRELLVTGSCCRTR